MHEILNSVRRKIIPSFIRQKFSGQIELQQIASNAGWMISDTLIQIITNLVVSVWLARYLGPELRGIMTYAESLLAIFIPISALGIGEIFVREVVREPDRKNELLGTAFILQTIGYLSFLPIIIGTVIILRKGDALVQTTTIILAVASLFDTSRIFNWWFSSQLKSKYIVWSNRIVEFLTAGIKIGLIVSNASFLTFIIIMAMKLVVLFLVKTLFYRYSGGKIFAWKFSRLRAKQILRDSWPLAFAFIAITINSQIDNLMVGQFLDNKSVGIYGEATRVSRMWYFIPAAIATSSYPVLVKYYENLSTALFQRRVQQFLDALSITGYLSAIPASIFAPVLMNYIYGPAYAEAGTVLAIHVWTFIFAAIRYGMDRWLMIQNHTRITVWSVAIGAITNIILNWLLIPTYGIIGAVWATLISNILSIYVSSIVFSELRPLFSPLILALFAPVRIFSYIRPHGQSDSKG